MGAAPAVPDAEAHGGSGSADHILATLAETMGPLDARPHYSPLVLAGLARATEFGLLCATGVLVHLAYVVPQVGYGLAYDVAIPAMAALAILVFQALRINNVAAFRAPIYQGFRIAGGWSLVVMAALGVIFFLKLDATFSRVWMVGWYGLGLGALLVERGILSIVTAHMTRTGRLDRRTVVVGGGPAGAALLEELSKQQNTDLRICGVFDDRTDARSPDVVAGYPKLGNVDDLVALARHTRIDLIIFTLPITAEQRLLTMLRKLWVLPIDIRLAAHTNKLKFRPRSYSYIGSVPVLDVFDKPIADWDVVMKTIFDRVVGALALVVLSPLLLAVAIAVKLDSRGPVLFKQKRYGFNNEAVEVYKFRSMYVDKLDFAAAKQVTRDDPRVTRVGRFIRKTSMDELPQLFNVVFKGNLSLVGPRPHAVHAKAADRQYDDVVDGYFARHRVKPGITGWAQINGWRGETDTPVKIQRRVEHDLAYIENWSLFFDLYILLITPFALIKTENAY
ncbi:undecaprenyl-phosphate glucose phosphotransferase [Lichenibacterium ramalinae]|uniref:Undecaprenyl-phosphate glucose phosphotransferase n=2 Tax=Lichenibacterium ramalinae TaxID=2316527 RepID=A0A4Q2RDX8_9HYPH|nr:undecaprenyl-phosphate glucose phosphotransferase [Lichenibacterium ramalinae]